MLSVKKNQQGFTLVEGLLIVIALALIIFVGYYVWNSQQKSTDTLESATKSSENASPAKKTAADNQSELKQFILATCSSKSEADVEALFANRANQTADTDNIEIEGNYAIANFLSTCKLQNGNDLTTLFMKKQSGKWALSVDKPVGVSCEFLTQEDFPETLRAPYCQNT